MFIKLGGNTWVNESDIRMVQKRDSYTRVWYVDGTYRDITGEWEKNMIAHVDGSARGDEPEPDSPKNVEDENESSVLDQEWHYLDLDTRTFNMLNNVIAQYHNINTVRDLYKIDQKGYMKFRGFGRKCMLDLNDTLQSLHLPAIHQ